MSKRLFEILDIMSQSDEMNKTATAGVCNQMVSANKVKAGGHVTMGVPEDVLYKIMNGKLTPILVLIDFEEYKKYK